MQLIRNALQWTLGDDKKKLKAVLDQYVKKRVKRRKGPKPLPLEPEPEPEPEPEHEPEHEPEKPTAPLNLPDIDGHRITMEIENACVMNPVRPRKIYHIVPAKQTIVVPAIASLVYEQWIDDADLISKMTKMLEESERSCGEDTVLVVASSRGAASPEAAVAKKLNEALDAFYATEHKRLLQVNIIHETDDTRNFVFIPIAQDKKQALRKVTNIIPSGESVTYFSDKVYDRVSSQKTQLVTFDPAVNTYNETVFPNGFQIIRGEKLKTFGGGGPKRQRVAPAACLNAMFDGGAPDPTLSRSLCLKSRRNMARVADIRGRKGKQKIASLVGGGERTAFLRLMATGQPAPEKDGVHLESLWWYRWFFSVPPCANGRLVQLSGTCWFNAALNIVLLSPMLSVVIHGIVDEFFKSNSKDAKRLEKWSLESCFNPKKPPTIREMLFVIVNHVFRRGERFRSTDENKMLPFAGRVKNAYRNNAFGFNAAVGKFDASNWTKRGELDSESYGDGGFTWQGIDAMLRSVFPGKDVQLMQLFNNDFKDVVAHVKGYARMNGGHMPKIIVMNCSQGGIKEDAPMTIKVNDRTYTLDGAAITGYSYGGEQGHAVAGLICNKVPYIYDSNNFVAVADWPHRDTSNYMARLRADKVDYGRWPPFYVNSPVYVDRAAFSGTSALEPAPKQSTTFNDDANNDDRFAKVAEADRPLR
jgi:hypothetical protein